jgi:hypothetical protein
MRARLRYVLPLVGLLLIAGPSEAGRQIGTLTVGEFVEFPKDAQVRYVLAALEVLWATCVMQCSDIKLTPMQVHLSLIGIGQVLPHTNFTVAIASTLLQAGCTHGVEAIRPKVQS